LGDPRPQAGTSRDHTKPKRTATRRRLQGLDPYAPLRGLRDRRPQQDTHTEKDGGVRMKASDYSCVPLCSDCHTQAPGAYHRVGKRAFELRHGICFAGIVAQLNREWCEKCA